MPRHVTGSLAVSGQRRAPGATRTGHRVETDQLPDAVPRLVKVEPLTRPIADDLAYPLLDTIHLKARGTPRLFQTGPASDAEAQPPGTRPPALMGV